MASHSGDSQLAPIARYFSFRNPAGWPPRPLFPVPGEYETFLEELTSLLRRRPWQAEFPDLASLIAAITDGIAGAVETDSGASARHLARLITQVSPGTEVVIRYEWLALWPNVSRPRLA